MNNNENMNLMSMNPNNFNQMSVQEITYLQNQLSNAHLQAITQELALFKNEYEINRTKEELERNKMKDSIEDFSDKLEDVEGIAIASNRVRQPTYGFVNQGDFGRMFNVSISSIRVGKLFKTVGIAMVSKSTTTPLRKHVDKLAKINVQERYTSFQWHYTGCLDHIDKWMKDNGYHKEFHMIDNEKDMSNFIDRIYIKHVQQK